MDLSDKSVIISHVNFHFADTNYPDHLKFCFFRNPLDRVMSNIAHAYYHLKKDTDINRLVEKEHFTMIHTQASFMGYNIHDNNIHAIKKILTNLTV